MSNSPNLTTNPGHKAISTDATSQTSVVLKNTTPQTATTHPSWIRKRTDAPAPAKPNTSKRNGMDATPQNNASPVKRIKTEASTTATETRELKPEKGLIDSYISITFVYIGPEPKSFVIHKGLLLKASTFFRDALSNTPDTEEGKTEEGLKTTSHEDVSEAITLPNEEPAIFKRFNDWLYTHKVTTRTETSKDLLWNVIVDTYVFAVRRGIPRLQNSCIDVAIEKVEAGGWFPGQGVVNALWKVTGAVWPLRRLFLQLFAVRCDLKTAFANDQGYCQRFLHDLTIILYEMKRDGKNDNGDDFWKARRMWHVNREDTPVAID